MTTHHKTEHHKTEHHKEHHKAEHEHLPHSVIVDLKHDVEALKNKLSQPDTKSHELILEIESLKDAVHQLNVIFEKALKEVKEDNLTDMLRSLTERLNAVVTHNETMAQSMSLLSDKVDSLMRMNRSSGSGMPSMGVQHSMGTPAMSGRVAPRLDMSSSMPAGFPTAPPPPGNRKRVGLF